MGGGVGGWGGGGHMSEVGRGRGSLRTPQPSAQHCPPWRADFGSLHGLQAPPQICGVEDH